MSYQRSPAATSAHAIHALMTTIATACHMGRQYRRFALAGLLALGFVAPAHADLTAAEKTDYARFVQSGHSLGSADRLMLDALRCCTTPEARGPLADVQAAVLRARTEHKNAGAHLLHTGVTEPLPQMTAAQWHDKAWFYLDRYRVQLDQVKAAIVNAQSHHVANATYQDFLRQALLYVGSAQTHANALDRALLYEFPWPALRPDKTIPTVVGPHGDYRLHQYHINRGRQYIVDAHGSLIAFYRAGADGVKFRDAATSSSNLLDKLDQAAALLADVPYLPVHATDPDRFCRALRVEQVLTIQAAQLYRAWLIALSGFIADAHLANGVLKAVDSWQHGVDVATWQGLVFPESTRCPADLGN